MKFACRAAIVVALIASLHGAASASCFLCSCSVATNNLAFGSYTPTASSPRDANATVTVTCTSVLEIFGSADIAISAGTSTNQTSRQMANGTRRLNYNVYRDAARTQVWGNGSGGTGTVTVPLNGIILFSSSATAYGRIPAGQWVGAGSYSDSLIVTVTY